MEKEQMLIELMKMHNENRIDYNKHIWSTLNFSQAFFFSLTIASVTGIINLYKEYFGCEVLENSSCNPPSFWISGLFLLLPLLGCAIIYTCKKNIERERKNLLYEEGQTIKIANYLGLNYKIPNKYQRWLPDEEKLFCPKWKPYTSKEEKIILEKKQIEDWIKENEVIQKFNLSAWVDYKEKNNSSSKTFNSIFLIEFIGGILLFFGILIFIIVTHHIIIIPASLVFIKLGFIHIF